MHLTCYEINQELKEFTWDFSFKWNPVFSVEVTINTSKYGPAIQTLRFFLQYEKE